MDSLQQRVWQRVRGQQESLGPEGFLVEERLDGDALQRQGLPNGSFAARADLLRGICRLMGTPLPQLPRRPLAAESVRTLLGRMLRRQRQYALLQSHPEFGALYEELAHSLRAACADLCRTLGGELGTR